MEENRNFKTSNLIELDKACVWHPFTQMNKYFPIPIISGKGSYLFDEKGNKYIDGISSWWVNLHGHCHSYISKKLIQQTKLLEHVGFADFTHAPAITLATRLLTILPHNLRKIFYSDNGSTAVETAIKMAFQFWYNLDPKTKKNKAICFKNSYHGDTFGAMSAAGKNGFNRPFWKQLFKVQMIDPPLNKNENKSLQTFKELLRKKEFACFIFEPLILGAGGMKIYSKDILKEMVDLCHEEGVLTIADEVMTGFGRTGTTFACEQINILPDFICLSKGLTGGYLPLGVTACTERIYEVFLGNTMKQAFLHGHSYTANPLACSCALASLDLYQTDLCKQQRERIKKSHEDFCIKLKNEKKLIRCECLGTILILEYKCKTHGSYFQSIRENLYQFFLDQFILLRPLGNVLYVMPPYCITGDQLKTIYAAILQTFDRDFI